MSGDDDSLERLDPFVGTPKQVGEGRYTVGEIIGVGGMGQVHQGVDTRTGRRVAVKLFELPMLRASEDMARFIAEAREMARLRHPQVVPVYDVGREGGFYWYAMLHMRSDLKRMVASEGPLEPLRGTRLMFLALRGLHAVHQAGIVHRDVKPGNLLVSNNEIRIADFGIARHREGSVPFRTQTNAAIGSLGYSAPEQRRDAKRVDERADIFGAGATWYHVLTGKKPDMLDMSDRDTRVLDRAPEPTRAAIATATSYGSEDRFATAREMAVAVAAAADGLAAAQGRPAVSRAWMREFDLPLDAGLMTRVLSWLGA